MHRYPVAFTFWTHCCVGYLTKGQFGAERFRMKSIALAAAIAVSLATNVGAQNAQNEEVLGTWKCAKRCAPGPGQMMLISERSDGTLVLYAHMLPSGLYKDIADGHWITPETIGFTSIAGIWFKHVKLVRVRTEKLLFEDDTEWEKY